MLKLICRSSLCCLLQRIARFCALLQHVDLCFFLPLFMAVNVRLSLGLELCIVYSTLKSCDIILLPQSYRKIFYDFTNVTPLEFEPTLNGLLAQVSLCG